MVTARRAAAWVFVAALSLFLIGPAVALFLVCWWRGELAVLAAPSPADWERWARLLGATIRVTLGAMLLAGALGVTMALAIHRSRGLPRRLLAALYPVPLLLPPVVVAIGWTHLLGKRGIAAAAWRAWTGSPELPFSIYGEAGSIAVLGLCWFPLVTMPTLVGLRALGTELLTAARLYAGPWRRTLKVTGPLLLPYAGAGAAFVGWLALGDFDVPAVFLRNAFPVEIYSALQVYPSPGRALLVSLPLLVLAALIGLGRLALARGAGVLSESRHSTPTATLDMHWRPDAEAASGARSRGLLVAAAVILLVAVVVPVLSLIHQAGGAARYKAGFQTAGPQIEYSFLSALGASVLMLALGLPYALLLRRARGAARAALVLLALIPVAIPGTVHGLAWTQALLPVAWGRAFLNHPAILACAEAARFFALPAFVLAATLDGLDWSLWEAARSAGAGAWRAWWRVAFPLLYPGLLAALAIGYALSIGELSCSILLQPVGYGTLPVRLSGLLHFGKDELLAALCVIQVILGLAPYLAVVLWLERTLEVRL